MALGCLEKQDELSCVFRGVFKFLFFFFAWRALVMYAFSVCVSRLILLYVSFAFFALRVVLSTSCYSS